MFLCYFQCLLAYIGLIATSTDQLCIPYTVVYLCDAFLTLSDFLLTLFIFAVIDIPMFRLFIVSVDRTIAIGSDFDPYGLLVISDSSNAISTSPRLFLLIFYLPLPFYTEQHCTSFFQLCKTLHHLDLTQTAFRCVPRPYPLNSTSTHCVLPRSITFFRLYFVLTHVLSV